MAEILGGLGLLLGSVPPVHDALTDLAPGSALALFALVVAITPANVFAFTHNAPGPGPMEAVPPKDRAVRLALQVLLLAALWGLAHPQ